MRAKLDESMPNEAADVIRGVGWECDTVHDERLGGAEDAEVAKVCRRRLAFSSQLISTSQTSEPTRRQSTSALWFFGW
jgi:hypothetical protein